MPQRRLDDLIQKGDLTDRAQIQDEIAMGHPEPLVQQRNGLVQNLDTIFRSTKTPSPIKKASYYSSSIPQNYLTQNTEESTSTVGLLNFQTRSQNIYNNLDKIFGAKQKQQQHQRNHSRGGGSQERRNPEITLQSNNPQKETIEEVLRGDYSRKNYPKTTKNQQEAPVGHAPFFAKSKVLRSSFISDFNHLKLDALEPALPLSSPKGSGSASVRLSVLSPRDNKKGYLRSSLEGTQLESLLTTRVRVRPDFDKALSGFAKSSSRDLGLKIGKSNRAHPLDSSRNPSFLTRGLRDKI